MKLVFLHGWSFGPAFWQPLQAALGHDEAVFLDRGYDTSPPAMALPNEPFIAIGHSAGVLWYLGQDLPFCRGVIAFNGFARFSHGTDFECGVPTRVLTRMRSRLTMDTADVVQRFRAQFDPVIPYETALDSARLSMGLDELLMTDGRNRALRWGGDLLSIEGETDELVSKAMRDASFPEARRKTLAGGHLLPVSAPQTCADLIRSWLETRS